MPFLVSNMRKKNLREEVAEEEVVGVVAAEVALTITMDVLRSKTVKVSTSTFTSLKSTTWCMKSIRNHCLRFIRIIMKISEEEEAVVEEEVDEVVVVATIMTREAHQIPVLKLPLSKTQRKTKMTCRPLEGKILHKENWQQHYHSYQNTFTNALNKTNR